MMNINFLIQNQKELFKLALRAARPSLTIPKHGIVLQWYHENVYCGQLEAEF